jgi:hypothetical protein
MRLTNWFKSRRPLICGGSGEIEVHRDGKLVGSIYYRRPTYEEILAYQYEYSDGLGSELQLKEIKNDNKKLKKIQEIVVRDLFLPNAEKIFIGSSGLVDGNGKPIEELQVKDQFKHIKKYHGYILVDMVAIAFKIDAVCKKKH